jgi:hypothetical protein
MSKLKSHLQIAINSINYFVNDEKLDENEINYLLGLAMADNVIDNDEKRVLNSILTKAIACKGISPSTVSHISQVKEKYSL